MKTLGELLSERDARISFLNDEARKCARVLREDPAVRDVLIFGSLAKGMGNVDSDIDLAVVVSGSKENRMKMTASFTKKLGEICSAPIDVLVLWSDELEESAIAREGMRI